VYREFAVKHVFESLALFKCDLSPGTDLKKR
jgi:hypothetical protein